MIDTHAHLADRFKQDADLSELKAVILSASSQKDSEDNLKLADGNPKLFPAIGIHPSEVGVDIDYQINYLDDLLAGHQEIVAIGECGLEYVEPFNAKNQEILFRGQTALSLKYEKPLIVHTRKAHEETLRILADYKKLRGVIHCYTGGKKRINKFLGLPGEWFLGIDGNLTYEAGLEEVVKEIPKEKLVLETDTPFLAPIPHRGETNQPGYVRYIYEKVAEIWQMSFGETEKIIDGNAKRLFGI